MIHLPPDLPPGSILDVLPATAALRPALKRRDGRATFRVLVLGYVEKPGELRLPVGADGTAALERAGKLPGTDGWATAAVRRKGADLPLTTRLREGDELVVRPKLGAFVFNVTTADGVVRPFYVGEPTPLARLLAALPKPWWAGASGMIALSSSIRTDRSFRARLGDLGRAADRPVEPFDALLIEPFK